jgi:hypothetical protein
MVHIIRRYFLIFESNIALFCCVPVTVISSYGSVLLALTEWSISLGKSFLIEGPASRVAGQHAFEGLCLDSYVLSAVQK